MNELRALPTRRELNRHVLRLHLGMTVTLAEKSELSRILRDLEETEATTGRVGVLILDRSKLRISAGSAEVFPNDLPPVLRDTVNRLDRIIAEAADATVRSAASRCST